MDTLALLPEASELDGGNDEYIEPIAEQLFNQKKIANLERNLGRMGKASRVQHESVVKLETDMKSTVSVQDLHSALGLAFEEVDNRLEETFREANTRHLQTFARRDELNQMQELIQNKVNRSEHNVVTKDLADLRMYFDSITQSVFMNHIKAIKDEFASKADILTTDETLTSKADVAEVIELRARLERIEDLTSRTNMGQPAVLQALADKASADLKKSADEHKALAAKASDQLKTLQFEQKTMADRVAGAESHLESISQFAKENREVNQRLRNEQENVLKKGITSLEDQHRQLDTFSKNARATLESLATDTKEFRSSAQDNFKQLHTQADTSKKQQEFLMTAMEMLKRKSRDLSKNTTSSLKEMSDEQEKLLQQSVALERYVKKKERETPRVQPSAGGSTSKTGSPDHCEELRPDMLDQLEKIMMVGGPPHQGQALSLVDVPRPPLPWYDADGKPCAQGLDLSLPRFPTPSTCDSSRASSVLAHARLSGTPRSRSALSARK